MSTEWYRGKILDPIRDGVAITLAGQRFVIPECTCEAYERLIPHFAIVTRAQRAREANEPLGDDESITVLRAQRLIASVYLAQNYPGMTPELVASYLILEDIGAVIAAANEARRLARGEQPGEALASETKLALN